MADRRRFRCRRGRRRANCQLRWRNRGDSRHGAVAGKDHRRAVFRRGRRHAVDSSFALGRAHQPRLGLGAAQAFLRELRSRAAGGGDRRWHLHFSGRAALVSVERCFFDAQTGDARRESDSSRARLADVRQPLALERNARVWRHAPQRRQQSSGGACSACAPKIFWRRSFPNK